MDPPAYPTRVDFTPANRRNAASTPQKQPAPNVAFSIALFYEFPNHVTLDRSRGRILVKLRVHNQTRGKLLADRADIADDSAKRRIGLLKHTSLAPGEGLWISPSE